MYKLKYIFILIITFVITSCSTDQVEIALGIADPIEVSVSETSVQDPVTRATLAGPVSYFESGDAIGIFVVDKSGNVVKSNVKYTYNGTSWNPESGAAITYSRDHKYYAYYPYTASVAGAPTSSTAYKDYPSANVVLKNLASSWTVQSDQSTKANYKKSDLMTAAYKGTGVDNNAVVFQMNHRMGLAIVSMSKKTVSGQKYEMKQDPSYTWTYGTATLTSSNKFTTRIPYTSSSKYYYIIKASTATTLSASNTLATTTSGKGNSWSMSVTIAAGKYKAVPAPQPSIDASTTIVYEMKVGDVLFADGAMGRDASEYGSDRVPVALVFSTTTSTKDKALGYKHGYAMALHDLGKGGQIMWSDLTDNPTGHFLASNDAATIKADMDGLTYNRKLTKRSNYSSIKSHYPAIELARTYNDKSANVVSGASEWYLPSTGQWWTMLKNFASLSDTGNTSLDETDDSGFYYDSGAEKVIANFAAFLSGKGVSFDNLDNTGDKTYWTSSEFSTTQTWYLALWAGGEIYLHRARTKDDHQEDLWRIRPVCAF